MSSMSDAAAAAESSKVADIKVLPTPLTSKTDKKEYKAIQLSNGLRALLISDTRYDLDKLNQEEEASAAAADDDDDEEGEEEEEEEGDGESGESGSDDDEPEGDDDGPPPAKSKSSSSSGLKKSAAGLSIGIGSFSDPQELQGLAHFLEHMVFMGSPKYPDENTFDEFCSKHGGYDNACTDNHLTTFYFEIQRREFRKALDIFAQFFVDPLMKKDAMEREREAVDSEFQMALPSDSCKRLQLMGSVAATPGHPVGKFLWGNKESLKVCDDEETHKRLHEFRKRHYTAQSMTLTVQSQETLDTLEQWVKESFADAPNNGLEAESYADLGIPFAGPQSNRIFKIVPVKDGYKLDMVWSLPSMWRQFRVDPINYISYIVGYEGKGSLISHLRKKVWALSLYAGNDGSGSEDNAAFSTFSLNVVLTEAGFRHVDDVIGLVFSFLKMLRAEKPSQRIFEELKRIKALDFEHSPEPQPVDNVENLCGGMQLYPPEMYLTGGELLFDFDADLIDGCVQRLTVDSACICLTAKDYKDVAVKTEKWFKTKYVDVDISKEQREAWTAAPLMPQDFFLPEPNNYIADDVSLLSNDVTGSNYPEEILSDGFGHLYYRHDAKFEQPRALATFSLLSPKFKESVEAAICLDLLVFGLDQLMIEDIYPATQALLDYTISVGERGEFNIRVSGLRDKLPNLLRTITEHLTNFGGNMSESTFKAVKDETKRNYFNFFIKPSRIVRDMRLKVIQDCFWTAQEKHAAIDAVTVDRLKQFVSDFCTVADDTFVQGLVQGNIAKDSALQMYRMVTQALQPTSGDAKMDTKKKKTVEQMVNMRCAEVPVGEAFMRVEGHDPKNTNTVVVNYYQWKPADLTEFAVFLIGELLIEEPVFDVLRTKEQLGYSVRAGILNTYGTLAFYVYVNSQATKFTADHVQERIEVFLDWFVNDKLAKLTDEEYEETVATLVKTQTTADVTLSEEFNRNWGEMREREYCFDRKEKLVRLLEAAKKEQMVETMTKLLGSCKETRRKLSVQVVGNPDGIKIQEGGADTETETEIDPNGVYQQVLLQPEGKEASFIADAQAFKSKLKTFPVHLITK